MIAADDDAIDELYEQLEDTLINIPSNTLF